jgi:WD40 repeat protein
VKIWDVADIPRSPILGEVKALAVSPDGRHLAVAAAERNNSAFQAVLLDATSGDEVHRFPRMPLAQELVFDPTGKWLIAASFEGDVCVWDVCSRREVSRLRVQSKLRSMAVDPEGRRLATVAMDSTLRVWDLTSGQQLLRCITRYVPRGVAFDATGKRLFVGIGGYDRNFPEPGFLQVFDATTGQELTPSPAPTESVGGLALSPDGRLLALGRYDGTVTVHDAKSGQLLHTLRGHSGSITGLVFSPESDRLVSAGLDHTLTFWDLRSGNAILTMNGLFRSAPQIAIDPRGRWLFAATYREGIQKFPIAASPAESSWRMKR